MGFSFTGDGLIDGAYKQPHDNTTATKPTTFSIPDASTPQPEVIEEVVKVPMEQPGQPVVEEVIETNEAPAAQPGEATVGEIIGKIESIANSDDAQDIAAGVEDAYNWLIDETLNLGLTGGPGGYFGAGAEHDPFGEGVVDVPDLRLPNIDWDGIKTVLNSIIKLPSIGLAVIDKAASSFAKGFLDDITIGFLKTPGESNKTDEEKQKIRDGIKAYYDSPWSWFARNILGRSYESELDQMDLDVDAGDDTVYEEGIELLGSAYAFLTGGTLIASAFTAQFGKKVLQPLSLKLRGKVANGGKQFKIDAVKRAEKLGFKIDPDTLKIISTTNRDVIAVLRDETARRFTAKEIAAAAASFSARSVATIPAGTALATTAAKIGSKGMKEALKKAGAAMIPVVSKGTFIGVEFLAAKEIAAYSINATAEANGIELSEDDIDKMATWTAWSLIMSRIGATTLHWLFAAGYAKSFIASELLQYLVFTGAGGGGGTLADFIHEVTGVNSDDTLNAPIPDSENVDAQGQPLAQGGEAAMRTKFNGSRRMNKGGMEFPNYERMRAKFYADGGEVNGKKPNLPANQQAQLDALLARGIPLAAAMNVIKVQGGSVGDKEVIVNDVKSILPTPREVLEFVPVIGDILAAEELVQELRKNPINWAIVGLLAGTTAIGVIPGVGDALAKGGKAAARALKAGADEAVKRGKGAIAASKRIPGKAADMPTAADYPILADRELLAYDKLNFKQRREFRDNLSQEELEQFKTKFAEFRVASDELHELMVAAQTVSPAELKGTGKNYKQITTFDYEGSPDIVAIPKNFPTQGKTDLEILNAWRDLPREKRVEYRWKQEGSPKFQLGSEAMDRDAQVGLQRILFDTRGKTQKETTAGGHAASDYGFNTLENPNRVSDVTDITPEALEVSANRVEDVLSHKVSQNYDYATSIHETGHAFDSFLNRDSAGRIAKVSTQADGIPEKEFLRVVAYRRGTHGFSPMKGADVSNVELEEAATSYLKAGYSSSTRTLSEEIVVEGWADFLAAYSTDPSRVKMLAPTMVKKLEQRVSDDAFVQNFIDLAVEKDGATVKQAAAAVVALGASASTVNAAVGFEIVEE